MHVMIDIDDESELQYKQNESDNNSNNWAFSKVPRFLWDCATNKNCNNITLGDF